MTESVIIVSLLSDGVPERTPVVELKSSQAGAPDTEREIPCSVKNVKLPGFPTAHRDRAGDLINGTCIL